MKLTDKTTSSSTAIQADVDKLVKFLSMYCKAHHGTGEKSTFTFEYNRLPAVVKAGPELCSKCTSLLRHAIVKRVLCPLDPKPKCRKCPQHCYLPQYRDEMEKVMKYAGPRSLLSRS